MDEEIRSETDPVKKLRLWERAGRRGEPPCRDPRVDPRVGDKIKIDLRRDGGIKIVGSDCWQVIKIEHRLTHSLEILTTIYVADDDSRLCGPGLSFFYLESWRTKFQDAEVLKIAEGT